MVKMRIGPRCGTPEARKVVKTQAGLGPVLLLAAHGRRFGRNLALQEVTKTWGATISDAHVPTLHVPNKTFLWKKPMTAADGRDLGPSLPRPHRTTAGTPGALVALFQRLDREGRERARAAAGVRDETGATKKASKEQKVAAIDATVKRLSWRSPRRHRMPRTRRAARPASNGVEISARSSERGRWDKVAARLDI